MDEAVEQAVEACGGPLSNSSDGPSANNINVHAVQQQRNKRGLSEDRQVVDMPPIDPSKAHHQSKHSFEDVPVTSKYATMMAARALEHPEAETEPHDDNANNGSASREQRGAAVDEDADGDEERQSNDSGGDGGGDSESEHAGTPPPARRPPQHSSAAAMDDAEDPVGSGGAGVADHAVSDGGVFNVAQMPKWEQDVYTAIHSCTDEPSAEALLTSNAMEASEIQGVLGRYASSCLLSKRWKLREAAVRAITQHVNTLFPNSSPVTVVTSMCRYLDFRSSGLQDSITNVVVASCGFLQMVLKGGVADCTISQLLPTLAVLLPRLIFRAAEALTKVRDPVILTVLAFAEVPEFSVDRAMACILADPVDQDKRRISNLNARIQIARLQIAQQLLEKNPNYAFPGNSFDNFMTKLMLPCLNHQNNEVRDLSVKIMASREGLDLGRYISQVSNPAVVSTLQRSSGSNPAAEEEKSRKRNTSATKRSGKRSVEPR
jgi:hypothetical protein